MKSLIPIRRSRYLSLSLLLLSWWCASAQDAEEFFHGGAQRFLTNNIPGALEVVTNGLQRFPDDQKLQKLYELLNQQQQQQQNQQDQPNQNQDQQSEQQQDKKEDQSQESKNEQTPPPEDKKPKEPEAQSKSNAKDQADEKPGQNQPATVQQMTPEEAKQLLDAQKGEEQVLIFQPKGEPKNRQKQLKDW